MIRRTVSLDSGVRVNVVNDRGDFVAGVAGVPGLSVEVAPEIRLGADIIVCDSYAGFEPHTHPGHHLLYVLEGSGTLDFDSERMPLTRHALVYVPAEHPHAMKASAEGLAVLAIGLPHYPLDSPARMRTVRNLQKGGSGR